MPGYIKPAVLTCVTNTYYIRYLGTMMRFLPFLLIAGLALVLMVEEVDASEDTEYENPEIQLKFNLKEDAESLTQQTKMPDEPE
ncbi:uncharacterized protein METZ01_LOCUS177428, partial [marine metagenome]